MAFKIPTSFSIHFETSEQTLLNQLKEYASKVKKYNISMKGKQNLIFNFVKDKSKIQVADMVTV